jgi:hypothetical protein
MTQLYNSENVNEGYVFFRKRVGWVSFVPTLWQNDIQVASSVVSAQYYLDDGLANVLANLQATAAGPGNNRIDIELPAFLLPYTGINAQMPLGQFYILDAGAAFYHGVASMSTLVSGRPRISGISYGSGGYMGSGFPTLTLASGDNVSVNLTYRV